MAVVPETRRADNKEIRFLRSLQLRRSVACGDETTSVNIFLPALVVVTQAGSVPRRDPPRGLGNKSPEIQAKIRRVKFSSRPSCRQDATKTMN